MPMRIPRNLPRYTLSDAYADGNLVKVKCQFCSIIHRYRAGDLLSVCGDLPLWEIASHFRGEKCERKDFMNADWQSVEGADVVTVKVRKLVRVRLVRVFDWEEGAL